METLMWPSSECMYFLASWMRVLFVCLLFLFCGFQRVVVVHGDLQIRCFSCLAPKDPSQFSKYCSEEKYCLGVYCFKGPDSRSSGVLYGCNDSPPLDKAGSTCKVSKVVTPKENCYCKNIEFCNATPRLMGFLVAVLALGFQFL